MTEIIKTPSPLDPNVIYEVIIEDTKEKAQAEFNKKRPKLAGQEPSHRLHDAWYFPVGTWSAA